MPPDFLPLILPFLQDQLFLPIRNYQWFYFYTYCNLTMYLKVFQYHLSGLCDQEVCDLVNYYAALRYYDNLLTNLWFLSPF